MVKPKVTYSEKFTILTYKLDNLATLNTAIDQIYALMKRITASYELYKIKKTTKIKIDTKSGTKLHIIFPGKITNQKLIDSIIVEV
jgi:hypothetical protein